MSNEQLSKRMDALEKLIEKQDIMLRGDSENEGLMSIVRQLLEESKQRKYIQTTILIGIIGLLCERVFRMIGLIIDKI